MTYLEILVLVATCITQSVLENIRCDVNEHEISCPEDCAADYCPKNESSDETPCISSKSCYPRCKCVFNHRRAANGTCIPTEDCPPFDCNARPNEVYDPCPPFCPTDNCSQASPTGGCPRIFGHIFIRLICRPKCRCKEGFWRNNGICIPYNQCPNVKCSKLHETLTCTTNCDPEKTCENTTTEIVCKREEESCEEKCICLNDYYRNSCGECVLQQQCSDTKMCN